MKHLKLYEHFYKPIITLNRKSTGQKIELDDSESSAGNDAISAALKGSSIGNDIGLVAPDFTVSVFGKELEVSCQGQLIKDEQGEYHSFEYGKKWYDMFQDELKDTLKKNPRHFLGESISDNMKMQEKIASSYQAFLFGCFLSHPNDISTDDKGNLVDERGIFTSDFNKWWDVGGRLPDQYK